MTFAKAREFWRVLTRPFARLAAQADGGAASEFAMIAPVFLVFMLGSAEVGIIYFAKAALESVAETAARTVLTGQAANTGNATADAATFQTAVCNDLSGLFSCSGVMIDLEPATSYTSINTSTPTLTYNSSGAVTNSWVYNPGTTGTLMVLKVMYLWPTIGLPLSVSFGDQPNGDLLLISVQVFKNESIFGS